LLGLTLPNLYNLLKVSIKYNKKAKEKRIKVLMHLHSNSRSVRRTSAAEGRGEVFSLIDNSETSISLALRSQKPEHAITAVVSEANRS
jgi:hypothetical protein